MIHVSALFIKCLSGLPYSKVTSSVPKSHHVRTQRSPVPYPKVTTCVLKGHQFRTQKSPQQSRESVPKIVQCLQMFLSGWLAFLIRTRTSPVIFPVTNLRDAWQQGRWPAQVASSQVQFKKRSHPPNLKFLSSGTSGRGVLIVLGW